MELIEHIETEGKTLAYIVRAELDPESTRFFTPPEFNLQVGYVVYPAGKEIARHVHHPIERRIIGTAEIIVVKKGSCEVDFYTENRELVCTKPMKKGDILIMAAGGHGFRLLEDCILLEIKQGPYPGVQEKERF